MCRTHNARACFLVASLATLGAFIWQALLVYSLWSGNWTALYRTGDHLPLAPLFPAGTQVFKGSAGYDAQYYRVVAYDPLYRKGGDRYVDDPRTRYRRPLVSFLAYGLAMGRPGWIDVTYTGVILALVFAGSWWACQLALQHSRNVLWGLVFFIAPATLIGVNRLTIDIALAAFCLGYVVLLGSRRLAPMWFLLAAACLVRETGAILALAAAGAALWRKEWKKAGIFASSLLPALAWYVYTQLTLRMTFLAGRTMEVPSWVGNKPLLGILERMASPVPYPTYPPEQVFFFQTLDRLVLIGVLMAIWFAISWWKDRKLDAVKLAALGFALVPLIVSTQGVWRDVNGYGRFLTPMWLMVGMRGAREGRWIYWLPMLLVDLRLGVPLMSELLSTFGFSIGQ